MESKRPLIVSFGGGKGGVGKSVLSVNVSIALSQLGARVVLVDADFGAANLHTLLGIDRPVATLQSFVDKSVQSLDELRSSTGVARLELLAGSCAIPGAANLNHASKQKLLRHVCALNADVVVVDVGAGVAFNVLDFFDIADVRIGVMTPQLTSLQNTYSFFKCAVYRCLRRVVEHGEEVELLKQLNTRRDTDRMHDLLSTMEQAHPSFTTRLRNYMLEFGACVIGNKLESKQDLKVLEAMSRMFAEFLELKVPVLGTLPRSACIHQSVSQRVPFTLSDSSSKESRAVCKLAETVLAQDSRSTALVRAQRSRRPPAVSQTMRRLTLPYEKTA